MPVAAFPRSACLLLFFGLACAPGAPPPASFEAGAEEDWPTRAVTVWTDQHEFFFEHEEPVPGREVLFALHVTRLADGSARASGPLELLLRQGNERVERTLAEPSRPGIYLARLALPRDGAWEWTVRVDRDAPVLPAVVVHATEADALAAADSGQSGQNAGITMLKEQQWPIGLRTAVAAESRFQESVRTSAILDFVPGRAARLTAAWPGSLENPPGAGLPELGARVGAGELLGILKIPMSGGERADREAASLQQLMTRTEVIEEQAHSRAELERAEAQLAHAQSEFRRIEQLEETRFESLRQLDQARYDQAAAVAALQAAQGSVKAWAAALAELDSRRSGLSADPAFLELPLHAPREGIVLEAPHAPGEWVGAGSLLFQLGDARRIQVRVRVPEARLPQLGADPSARIRMPGAAAWQELPGSDGRRVLTAATVDAQLRAAELVFEVPGAAGLRPGALLEAEVALGAPREILVVPETAVVDEDGVPVVYLQAGGEEFVRRPVRLGGRSAGQVEILAGLSAGERVVTARANTVRLVALSGSIPEHAH